jgi:hypothetical protein
LEHGLALQVREVLALAFLSEQTSVGLVESLVRCVAKIIAFDGCDGHHEGGMTPPPG